MKKLLASAVAIFVMLVVGQAVKSASQSAITDSSKQSSEIKLSNVKYGFVSSCEGVGGTQTTCDCAFEALNKLHGESWWSDTSESKRVITTGYNKQETDAVVPCFK